MQEYLIQTFSDKELKEVMEDMYLDDTVDMIEEMPANVVRRILKHTSSGDGASRSTESFSIRRTPPEA